MKKFILNNFRERFSKYKWFRKFIGGQWSRLPVNNKWYPYDLLTKYQKEDWDFIKWFKKVQRREEEISAFLMTEEDDYIAFYIKGLTPKEAVDAYLDSF